MASVVPRRKPPNAVGRLLNRLSAIDPLSIFDPSRPKSFPRTVLVNAPLPPHAVSVGSRFALPGASKRKAEAAEAAAPKKPGFGQRTIPAEGWIFETNQVLTSKYNIVTFLPRNLLEQFRRVANVFFLALVILQFFPRFSTVSPALAALPLIAVLAITGVKDGYEDLKRHQSDRAINRIKVLTLRGTFHNPNLSHPKSRSFGVPAFLTNFFLNRSLARESHEAELDRDADVERKKSFWGKRRIRRPTLQGKGTGQASIPDQFPDVPALASGEKMQGDDYADERDSGTLKESGRQASNPVVSMPHLPHSAQTFDKPTWVKECWEDLQVGDFVRLRGDESVPADIVVCATSEEENVCYVETKNLDGETNLKSRNAVPELVNLRTSSTIANDAAFTIESGPADENLTSYTAAIVLHDGRLGKDGRAMRCPVNLNTVLLRGTVVRNTEWVVGVVLMTGRDTKIVMNSGGTPSKRSRVERQMNPMVFLNLLILAAMCIACAVVSYVLENRDYPRGAYWLFRDNTTNDNPKINSLVTFGNALITFQNIVPISLYISIEFVRLLQAYFIFSDEDICYRNGTTKRNTIARSWNLSDDLGQVEYIFSDKTGTLTQNVMVFRECSIGGKVYRGDSSDASDVKGSSSSTADSPTESSGDDKKQTRLADGVSAPFRDSDLDGDLRKRESTQAKALYAFFSNLALCHTVLASDEDGSIQYKAQSPDEAALVQAAADVGFVFLGREKNILRIQTPHDAEVVEFELLNVLEFSSARKRMSVVLRRINDDSNEGLMLLTKGADNVIFERLARGHEELRQTTDQHLEDFANEGLRTLCLAYKPLDEDVYEAWERDYIDATTLIEGRDAAIELVSDRLEQDLLLLGATAIEDRLQDGVPEAIADLKRAGLKIWVATGDKLETAIAIGKTCNLLSRDMNLIIIKGGEHGKPNSAYSQLKNALEKFFDAEGVAENMLVQPPTVGPMSPRAPGLARTTTGVSGITDIVGNDNGDRPGGYGLIIDGSSLRHTFEEEFTKDLLLELSTRCKAVVCCRTSPLQKAQIVRLVKDGLGVMCLAIGDGANDVSMIQAADIGVGVAGEEGLQAVNSSDYAIGQFRFLNRLLLVHGNWSYMRNSSMICNFFYKEIIGIAILFWFQFYSGFSATTVYEYTYLLFWNVIWTLLPVIAIGVFDRNISDHVLMQVPELYRNSRGNRLFNLKRFMAYMLDGIYQGAVIYFFLLYAYDTTTARRDGYDVQMYEFSTVMAIAAIFAANMYNGLNTRAWTWWVVFSIAIGPFLILAYTAVYSSFKPSLIWTYVYGNNTFLWPSTYFWLGSLFTIILSLAPRYLYLYISTNYYPSDIDVLAWTAKMDPQHDWINDPYMPRAPPPAGLQDHPARQSLDVAPIFSTSQYSRSSLHQRQDSYQLGRVSTTLSQTHDMSTGGVREGAGRGYGFDQADNMLPAPIRRYTSRTSETSSATRPRRGSIRVGTLELNPFLRTPRRDRTSSGALRNIFGGRRATIIDESPETRVTPQSMGASPSRGGVGSPARKGDGPTGPMLGDL